MFLCTCNLCFIDDDVDENVYSTSKVKKQYNLNMNIRYTADLSE